jgi:heat shock protein HtpX
MKSQYLVQQKMKNVTRTWTLMGLVGIAVIALGWLLSGYLGDGRYLNYFVIFAILQNIVAYWFSDKIALATSGAKFATESEYPMLWKVVRSVQQKTGIKMPRVYVIQDDAPNAFATGRNESNAAIAATTGILSILSEDELEGVIAHEFGHIQNKDILVNTIVVVLVGFLSLLAQMFVRTQFRNDENRGGSLVLGLVGALVAPLVGTLIQLAISRKREFLADATGAITTGHPESLARALEKINHYNKPLLHVNQATAHMFIANPFGNVKSLFMTHPPVEERVKALLNKN